MLGYERLSDKRTYQLGTTPLLSRNPSFVLRAANHCANRNGDKARLPEILRNPVRARSRPELEIP